MGEVAALFVIETKDKDGDEPEVLECDCGNTLLQIDVDFTVAYCPLCGQAWEPDNGNNGS